MPSALFQAEAFVSGAPGHLSATMTIGYSSISTADVDDRKIGCYLDALGSFRTNDALLRSTLVHSLNVFLTAIWQTGGLQGAQPSDGFYVKCDATNNPPAIVDAGQLICEVGIAVAAPMEFIVFEIHQDPAGSSISES